MIEIHWTWLAILIPVIILIWGASVPREKVINVLATLRIIKKYIDKQGLHQYCLQLFNPLAWVAIVIASLFSGVVMVFDTGSALVNDALQAGKRQKKPAK